MIPVSLRLENFMSHALSRLDFSQFDAALVIGAHNGNTDVSNGVGKTALFDAMVWALFDKCRFRTKDRVIKHGSAACVVEFIFSLEGSVYRVVRKLSRRSGSGEVSFHVQAGKEWLDLSCDTATMTNRKILEVVRLSYDTFINSVYFRQNDISRFASATASQRKDILKEALQIGIWDKYKDVAKARAKKLSGKKEDLEDRIKSLGNLDSARDENKQAISIIELKLQEVKNDLENIVKDFENARRSLIQAEADLSRVEGEEAMRIKERISQISSRNREITSRRDEIRDEIKANNEIMVKSDSDRIGLEARIIELAKSVAVVTPHSAKLKAIGILTRAGINDSVSIMADGDAMAAQMKTLEIIKASRTKASVKLKQLMSLEPGEECPICLSEIKSHDVVLEKRSVRQEILNNKVVKKDTEISELEEKLQKKRKLFHKANKASIEIDRTEFMISKVMGQYSSAQERNKRLQDELGLLAREWGDLKIEKQHLLSKEKELGNLDDLREAVDKAKSNAALLKGEYEKLRKHQMDLGVEYGNLQGHSEDLNRRLSERTALITRKSTITSDLDIHNRLVKAFGKNGVQAIIMENVTEDLQNYANGVLKRICTDPMTLDFVTQRQTESGNWVETFDIKISAGDTIADFEDLSGGEQVRISIALRLALSRLLMRRVGNNVKFLLLDEVDQALDRQGLHALASTINILANEFKVLVITHNDSMKDCFDHVITVQKGSSGSVLNQ